MVLVTLKTFELAHCLSFLFVDKCSRGLIICCLNQVINNANLKQAKSGDVYLMYATCSYLSKLYICEQAVFAARSPGVCMLTSS